MRVWRRSTDGTVRRFGPPGCMVDVGAPGLPLRLGTATPWLGELLGAGAA